jgi:hypothetical protein
VENCKGGIYSRQIEIQEVNNYSIKHEEIEKKQDFSV